MNHSFLQALHPTSRHSSLTLIMIGSFWVRLRRRSKTIRIVFLSGSTVWLRHSRRPKITATPLKARMWLCGVAMTILGWADIQRFWKLRGELFTYRKCSLHQKLQPWERCFVRFICSFTMIGKVRNYASNNLDHAVSKCPYGQIFDIHFTFFQISIYYQV